MTTASTKSAPRRARSARTRTGALGPDTVPATPPPPCGWSVVTSSWPPPPPHRGGRAPGTRIGTGAAPEPPKTPLGLLGLVVVAGGSRTARYWAVWAGGDILGGGYRDAVNQPAPSARARHSRPYVGALKSYELLNATCRPARHNRLLTDFNGGRDGCSWCAALCTP